MLLRIERVQEVINFQLFKLFFGGDGLHDGNPRDDLSTLII